MPYYLLDLHLRQAPHDVLDSDLQHLDDPQDSLEAHGRDELQHGRGVDGEREVRRAGELVDRRKFRFKSETKSTVN